MVLEIGEQRWKLHFHKHELTEAELAELKERQARAGHPNRLWDVDITCHLHSGPCIDSVSLPKHCVNGCVGVAHCSLKDQFERRTGHKTALARALKDLPVQTRTAIWDAYWKSVRRPKETSQHFRQRVQAQQPAQASA